MGLFSEAVQRTKETLRLSKEVKDFSLLAREIAKGNGVRESELRGYRAGKGFPRVRGILLWQLPTGPWIFVQNFCQKKWCQK